MLNIAYLFASKVIFLFLLCCLDEDSYELEHVGVSTNLIKDLQH